MPFTTIRCSTPKAIGSHERQLQRAGGRGEGLARAGDCLIYSASTNSALLGYFRLLPIARRGEDDAGILESGSGMPDLLHEARWGSEWLLSVQDPSGGLRYATCQQHFEPYGANRPERHAILTATAKSVQLQWPSRRDTGVRRGVVPPLRPCLR
jgi:hypothetical protein